MRLIFAAIFCFSFLLASEDVSAIDEAHNPNTPTSQTPNSKDASNPQNSLESVDSHKASSYPREKIPEEKTASWIHSIGLLIAYFEDGDLKQSYGTLLDDGYFITTATLVNSKQEYPKSIYVKMQDDSAKPLICVAQLQLQAVDDERGLALLKTIGYTDDYCTPRPQSFYHERIYKLYSLDIFARPVRVFGIPSDGQDDKNELFYPLVRDRYSFSIGSMGGFSRVYYYDKKLKKDIFYGYAFQQEFEDSLELGKPFFDKYGKFVGIYSLTQHHDKPMLVDDSVVRSFLCNLQADFKLSTWKEKDCRSFQNNIITNIRDIAEKPLPQP